VHEVSLCILCHDYEWHRRHQLKEHLQQQHPDVDLPAALCEVTRSRRKATVIKTRQRQQRASPADNEHARWGCPEMGLCPSLPPPAVVVEVAPVSPATFSFIVYDPKSESEKSAKKRKRGDDAGELLQCRHISALKGACTGREDGPRLIRSACAACEDPVGVCLCLHRIKDC
jgi:hypothetical protein